MDISVLKKIQKIKRQTAETLNDEFAIVRQIDDRAEVRHWCKWKRSETKKIPTVDTYYKTYL